MTATAVGRVTLLCVDDDPEILAVMRRFLRGLADEVITVDNPLDALEVLRTRAIAVLVSDFEMPQMTGVELAVRARALQPETTRLLVTGHKAVETALAGINVAEVFRFLHKPFDPEVLQREVVAGIAHHQSTTEVVAQRTTVIRRQRLLAALESDYPGIGVVVRDDDGAYLLDGDARLWVLPSMTPIGALWPARR
jgi:response regulator RpfG family c-di-GMP phosphodiesterase